MNDLDLERLVESARQVDQPSSAQAQQLFGKIAESVGAAGTAAGTTAAGSSAAGAAGSASATGTAGGSAATASLSMASKLSLVVAGLGLASGVAYVASSETPDKLGPPASTPPADRVRVEERSPLAAPQLEADGEPLPPEPDSRETGAETTAAPTPRVPVQGASKPADTLSREVSLIRQAKLALDGANPQRALSLLSTYDREFPTGTLQAEAQATRVLALCALDQASTARNAAQKLDKDSPLGKKMLTGCPKDSRPP